MNNETLCERTQKLLSQGAHLIDVRSSEEYLRGALRNAINLPLQMLGQIEKRFAKDQPLVLYCASGKRSAIAKQLLEQAGYRRVLDAGSIQHLASCRPPA